MKTGIVAFFAGVLLLYQLQALPVNLWIILLLPLLALLFRNPVVRLIAWFTCGFLWALLRADMVLEKQFPQELESQNLVVNGSVVDLPRHSIRRQQFIFKVDSIEGLENEKPVSYRFKLNWYDDYPQIISGERWRLMVRVKRPNGFMNPGGRDYEASLFQRSINATGYVKEGEKLEYNSPTLLQSIHRWRGEIFRKLKTHQPELNGIIPALGLGIRDDLNPEMWRVLKSTGTIHLIAISGLHIGLISALAFFVGRWLWSLPVITLHRVPAVKAGAVFAMFAAVFYAALAGFSIPTQRALIMVLTIMFCLISNKQLSRFDIFAIALFSVLMFSPAAVISPGFWLSFAAVAIIFYSLSGRASSKGLWHASLKIHFILALGLSPILLVFFGQNPVLGPLANIIAVPFFGLLITPLVLLGMVSLSVYESAGVALLSLVDFLISTFWPLLKWLADLPYTSLNVTIPSTWIFIFSLLGITILLIPRGLPGRWLGGLFILPVFLFKFESPVHGEFDFTLLDVGQGLSSVIRTKEHVLLYDTGARFSADFDIGKAVVLPYLKSIGIKSLDKVIVSHGDNDHRGGYESIVEQMPITETLTSVPEKLTGNNISLCHSDQHWNWDGVNFEIIHPGKNYEDKENNRSCVLKVSNGYQSVLLTGDIEASAESTLLSNNEINLDVDLLVAPHHGSKTSSTEAFLEATSPQYALFSTGYRNRYHHPAETVLVRYRNSNIKLLDTAHEGAIRFHIGESISDPDRYRWEHGHFWSRDRHKNRVE